MIKDDEIVTEHVGEEKPSEKKGWVSVNVDEIKESADKAAQVIGSAAKDVGEFADTQFKQAKHLFGTVSKNLEESLSKQRLEKYKPLFVDRLNHDSFVYPNMINVVEYDKRMDIEECRGAIGYQERINNVDILGIYKADVDKYGITLYPEIAETAYYVHPLQKNTYIEISEYFKYLKQARVAELEYIAQSLGAKHFKVSIMEETSSEQIKKTSGGAKLGFSIFKAGTSVESNNSEKKYEYIGVAAENIYPGKDPVRPELKFWANNESIKSLVEQRMDLENRLISKTFRLDYNTSTGIKEKEAAKIDGALKALKFSGAGSISEEARSESRKRIEYTIEF